MKWILILLAAVQLWSAETTPALFAQMGDPLYGYAERMGPLGTKGETGREATAFAVEAGRARRAGFAAEKEGTPAARQAYLRQLRGLQKAYDRLMAAVKREMLTAMAGNKTALLLRVASTEPPVALRDGRLRETIAAYCDANGLRGRSAFLDRVVREGKVATRYAEGEAAAPVSGAGGRFKPGAHVHPPVTVLSTSTCPHCIRTKQFLTERHIPFRDLNVNTTKEGRRLYKKYDARGVPMIIVGKTRITGFDPKAILRAYGD